LIVNYDSIRDFSESTFRGAARDARCKNKDICNGDLRPKIEGF